MCLKRLLSFSKTIGFKLTLWYSAILGLSFGLLFLLMHFLVAEGLSTHDHESMQLKLKELSALYEIDGMPLIEKELTVLKKFGKHDPFFVRVAEPENRTVFMSFPYPWVEFDIKELQETSPRNTLIYIPSTNDESTLEVLSARLGDGYWLQVGKSTKERRQLLQHVGNAMTIIAIAMVFLALTGGWLLTNRALRPIRHLIETVESIDAGNTDARVQRPHTKDELHKLVELFNAMLERIAGLIKAMKGSLDIVAHDLRTPLTRMRCIAEEALASGEDLNVCLEALSDCMEESERVITMLNTLMDISEAETGTMKLNREPIDISVLIEDVVDLYSHVAEEKDIALTFNSHETIILSVDQSRIRQVLANLIDNGIKYTPNGGNVHLEAHKEASLAVVTVRDTGVGIPSKHVSRIWERLYRADESRSQKGLGLGLSLVRAVVRAHEGRTDVWSEPGKGSVFSVRLPLNGSDFTTPYETSAI